MDSTNINSNTNFNHNHNHNNPDLKMKQVEQELKRKKRELEKKKKVLEKNMTENHHLETICSDYKNYFDNIIEQKKKELRGERNPLFMLDKLKDRQFPVTKGGSGQRAESLQQLTRQVASLPNEFSGNSHTFKHHKSSGARITYRKY